MFFNFNAHNGPFYSGWYYPVDGLKLQGGFGHLTGFVWVLRLD